MMLIATHSSIDCFRTCHKKYYWEYDQLLKPKQKAWALLDGEAFDYGLNWLYRHLGGIEGGKPAENGKSILQTPLIWGFEKQSKTLYTGIDNIYEKGGRNEEEAYIHKETVKAMLEGYTLAYPPDEFDKYTPQPTGEVPVVNTYMREGKFILKFKADALVNKADKVYLFETKTTSASSIEQFLDSLRLDDQPTTYLYGFRRLGYPVLGVIYNVIRKPRHKQGKTETAEAFAGRIKKALLDDAVLLPEERKYYFRLDTIYKSPKELQEFEEEIKQVSSDMENYMPYKSPSRCGSMYGKKCPFLPLCDGSDSQDAYRKKVMLHEEYEEEK